CARKETLSTGVMVSSRPSRLNVPAWQMVSALLGGVSLRVATWGTSPAIYSTTNATKVACWDTSFDKPGAVAIATTGRWDHTVFGLRGGGGPDFNHAKIGVSTSGNTHYAIFGDMNQQGTLRPDATRKCSSSQNGRGGLFYVLDDATLAGAMTDLLHGTTAPAKPPAN